MPLLTQNKRMDRVHSTTELFSKYSHLKVSLMGRPAFFTQSVMGISNADLLLCFLKENAKLFRSKPAVTVDQTCLLYVQQREFAATTPSDSESYWVLMHLVYVPRGRKKIHIINFIPF